MIPIKYDLHCHSIISDGMLSIDELADYAIERDIKVLALTDHDSISGLEALNAAFKERCYPIDLIKGVEISALVENTEIHIVGLGLNGDLSKLENKLAAQREKRWKRAEVICDKLDKCRVHGIYEHLKQNIVEVVTRTHIARAIVELGYVPDMKQAFKKYVGKQGRIKAPKSWMGLQEAIDCITSAGGIAILAHPTRYPLSNRKLSLLIQAFKRFGGHGIEASYSSLTKDKIEWIIKKAEENNLMVSAGSDFHYPNLKWSDLGRFPQFSASTPHVLERLVEINKINPQ